MSGQPTQEDLTLCLPDDVVILVFTAVMTESSTSASSLACVCRSTMVAAFKQTLRSLDADDVSVAEAAVVSCPHLRALSCTLTASVGRALVDPTLTHVSIYYTSWDAVCSLAQLGTVVPSLQKLTRLTELELDCWASGAKRHREPTRPGPTEHKRTRDEELFGEVLLQCTRVTSLALCRCPLSEEFLLHTVVPLHWVVRLRLVFHVHISYRHGIRDMDRLESFVIQLAAHDAWLPALRYLHLVQVSGCCIEPLVRARPFLAVVVE
eukprot:m51a1_g14512 hypothetical protein (265) ;mRNA; f:833535-834871